MKRLGFLITVFFTIAGLAGGSPQAETKPTEAEAKAMEALEKAGGSVRPIAQNDNRLEVDFPSGRIVDHQRKRKAG
jgi:hypothetical protein